MCATICQLSVNRWGIYFYAADFKEPTRFDWWCFQKIAPFTKSIYGELRPLLIQFQNFETTFDCRYRLYKTSWKWFSWILWIVIFFTECPDFLSFYSLGVINSKYIMLLRCYILPEVCALYTFFSVLSSWFVINGFYPYSSGLCY